MNTRLARTIGRSAAALSVAAAALIPAGVAVADTPAPAGAPAPSACRPANQQATVTQSDSSAGHRHYAVTITAGPGTAPCTLKGSPTHVGFSLNGSPRAINTVAYGNQDQTAVLAPGHPVTFDVQVQNTPGGATANEVHFTPVEPDGQVPGDFVAHGPLTVDGTPQIGPVTAAG
ncbi:DUF4232 domain-containing protein [Pseudonocardia phyllosphaerae]|uniref:DUF4232 domain-containing protein n=1 Tax=Pseudonocardia phyllosphaerae TaxID=3390502 RepID=UPI00397ADD74